MGKDKKLSAMIDIQYPSAINEDGNYIKAKDLTKDSCGGHSFRCPHCGEVMTPVLGPVRVHHFRHLGTLCKRDSYLHGCAEAAFMEEYQRCLDEGLPFYLEMPVPVWCNKSCVLATHQLCHERYNRKTVDLTLDYKRISQEARVQTGDKEFRRPDILLQTEGGKQSLWIEFFVTHAVDENKQKKGRIIEIKINSEKDIDTIIRGHRIVQSDDDEHWVKLYNISTVVLDEPIEKQPPCEQYYIYEVGFGFGYPYIADKIPGKTEGIQYRIALRLNWRGKYDDEGYCDRRITQETLHNWCEKRFLGQDLSNVDEQIAQLIESEYRAEEIKPIEVPRQTSWHRPKKKTVEHAPEIPAPIESVKAVNWIDLGLPSGVLWADADGHPDSIADVCMLPSSANIQELICYCKQEPCDFGLKITGPNGNHITLKAAQYRLSTHKYRDSVDMVSIYALTDSNYLHINEDDYSPKHLFRCVRKPL